MNWKTLWLGLSLAAAFAPRGRAECFKWTYLNTPSFMITACEPFVAREGKTCWVFAGTTNMSWDTVQLATWDGTTWTLLAPNNDPASIVPVNPPIHDVLSVQEDGTRCVYVAGAFDRLANQPGGEPTTPLKCFKDGVLVEASPYRGVAYDVAVLEDGDDPTLMMVGEFHQTSSIQRYTLAIRKAKAWTLLSGPIGSGAGIGPSAKAIYQRVEQGSVQTYAAGRFRPPGASISGLSGVAHVTPTGFEMIPETVSAFLGGEVLDLVVREEAGEMVYYVGGYTQLSDNNSNGLIRIDCRGPELVGGKSFTNTVRALWAEEPFFDGALIAGGAFISPGQGLVALRENDWIELVSRSSEPGVIDVLDIGAIDTEQGLRIFVVQAVQLAQIARLDPLVVPGDVNGDRRVNDQDLGLILDGYGQQGPGLVGDANADLFVDDKDVAVVLDQFGKSCPDAEPR